MEEYVPVPNVKVTFENNRESVFEAWSLVTAFYIQGDKSVGSLQNNNIYLTKNTSQFEYGTIIRASELYRNYASKNEVTDPDVIKFWRNSSQKGAVTIMSSEVILTSSLFTGAYIGSIVGGLPGIIFGAISGAALATYLPDISIGTKTSKGRIQSVSIINSVFHELAHASHYRGIGSGRVDYWNSEYLDMCGGWLELLQKGESPFDNCYNNGKSKLVCLIESWAYFYGDYLTNQYYFDYAESKEEKEILEKAKNITSDYELFLDNGYDNGEFFYNNGLYKLLNAKTPYSIHDLFLPLKNKNTKSAETYVNKLYENNKEKLTILELKNILTQAGARF